jgi:hypothetical protein
MCGSRCEPTTKPGPVAFAGSLFEGDLMKEEHVFFSFPLFWLSRISDGSIKVQSDDGYVFVELFRKRIFAERHPQTWDDAGEVCAIESMDEFKDACRHWRLFGVNHVALDPTSEGATMVPLTEFIEDQTT